MKLIASTLITLIAAAAFATEHTAPATTTGTPAATTATPAPTHGKAPGAKMATATAPTEKECTDKPETKGCDKWKKDTKKTK